MEFVAAIFGALLKWVAGWWAGRQAAKSIENANDRQASAAADAAQERDRSSAAVEQARQQTDVDLDRVHRDAAAGGVDGLQQEHETVEQAIERANTSGGLQ